MINNITLNSKTDVKKAKGYKESMSGFCMKTIMKEVIKIESKNETDK